MQYILNQPLTIDELKKLHEFLSFLHHNEAAPMSITNSHGFLTAILSAPNLIMPSEWQPILFGGHPNFDSMEQANTIIQLIGRLNNQISKALRNHENFEPLIFDNGSVVLYQSASPELIAEWCQGYLKGSRLDADWYADEEAVAYLLPFGVLSGEFDLKGGKDDKGNIIEDDIFYKERMKQQLPLLIKGLFNRFQEHRKNLRKPLGTHIREGHDMNEPIKNPNKIGRNESCPCGSGKKYKKCCIETTPSIH